MILQVTPSTRGERLERIATSASGFLYVINVEGVTGARDSLTSSTVDLIERTRKHTDVPLMAGFGISKREHAKSVVSKGADGVITGSAIAEIYGRSLEDPDDMLPEIGKFSRRIKQGCVEGYEKCG